MKEKTRVHIFGNRELDFDSTPLRLLPKLRDEFCQIEFIELDPNEDWEIPDPFLIIDTIAGIPDVRTFYGIEAFDAAPTVSVHDFDAVFHLRYLAKLGKLQNVVIIGVSPEMNELAALPGVRAALRSILVR